MIRAILYYLMILIDLVGPKKTTVSAVFRETQMDQFGLFQNRSNSTWQCHAISTGKKSHRPLGSGWIKYGGVVYLYFQTSRASEDFVVVHSFPKENV